MIRFKKSVSPTDFPLDYNDALDFAISLKLEPKSTLILVPAVEHIAFNSLFTIGSVPASVKDQKGTKANMKQEKQKVVSSRLKRQVKVDELMSWGRLFVMDVRIAMNKEVHITSVPINPKPDPEHTSLELTSARDINLSCTGCS